MSAKLVSPTPEHIADFCRAPEKELLEASEAGPQVALEADAPARGVFDFDAPRGPRLVVVANHWRATVTAP